ncbi:leucine-rich repeat protein [Jutongia huaianensis]|uniref:Leucine-rich repeat protein n=1 Tax=Jutongia huaianensis TaxID=2763668 RepID=A0ABR7N3A7_9FIRM|nr:leucine-rich repeat protein [Jutongia huaianensis]MBC8563098.1 leucine-rich repeat protein [Jutongia huaianensis]
MNKKNIPKYFPGLFFPALVLLLLTITINVPTAFAAASEEEISAFEKLDGIFQEYLLKDCIDPNKSTYTDDQLKEMTDDLQTYLDQCDITTTYKEMEAVSRYVANRVSYNLNDKRYNPKHGTELTSDNPYDVWSSKKAVCGGYTNLLNTLLVSRGIPSFGLVTKTHAYSIAYNKDSDYWIYIDATVCSRNRYDLERDDDTSEVLPDAEELWTSGGYNSAGFDMTIPTMLLNRAAYMVYSCGYLVKDGLRYSFHCNDSSFNTDLDLDTWKDMTDWNLTLFGPWGDDYSKNVKVTDIDGVPVHKVYDGFAGTDIESVDFSEASIKMIVSLFSSTTGTFEGCTKLKTVTLPDTVTQFYSQTFKNCTALEEINIPKSIQVIQPQEFLGCSSLKTVDFRGTSVVRICDEAFKDCTSLASVYWGEPKNLSIDAYAFQDCTNLETVDCSKTNISSIENYAFYNCSKLKKIDLSSSTMEQTGQSIFRACTSLEEVILPKTLKEINYLTFSGTAIKTLDLRETAITKIIDSGCANMDALKTLYLPATLEEFGDYAFLAKKSSSGKLYIYSVIPEADINAMADKATGVWSGRSISFPKGSYTIIYDGNGAAAGTMDAQTCMIDGFTFSLSKNAYTRENYTFTGWNTMSDGSGTFYRDEAKIYPLTETDQAEITLYAMWKDSSVTDYTITYFLNATNVQNDNPAAYTNNSDTITLKDPIREGYTFLGWFSDKELTQQVTEIAKGSTGNITLYAHWKRADACEHEWIQTAVIERATCSQEGTATRACTKCGKSEVITLPIDPDYHWEKEVVNKKPATTTEEGYTGDTICKACKKVLQQGEVIPKKGTASETPAASNKPDTSNTPAASNKPGTSNTPAASNAPAATKKPSSSNTPSATKKPSASSGTQDASSETSIKASAPKAVKGLRIVNQKPLKLIITWLPETTVKGYEVQYAMNKKFTRSLKKKTVKTTYCTVKKVKRSKTYFVRVRAYKLQGMKKIYSKWTKVKKIKVKK